MNVNDFLEHDSLMENIERAINALQDEEYEEVLNRLLAAFNQADFIRQTVGYGERPTISPRRNGPRRRR